MDKKATPEITFSAKNSDHRNCFLRLSLVNLALDEKDVSILWF